MWRGSDLMAYVRETWKNREVERPRTFTKVENPDGTITLVPAEGNIIEPGTPIIAVKMNNIEVGIEEALNKADQAFQSASDGKQVVATAITGKGVPTSSSDTFQKMATNINAIETDPSIGTTNAVASDLLLGKKAISQGQLVTGTIPTFSGFPVATDFHPYGTGTADGGNNMYLKMPAGYSDGTHWLSFKDPNLIPANVKAGVSLGLGMKLIGTAPIPSGNAVAAYVLTGYTFSNASGVGLEGSMVNRGAISTTIVSQGGQVNIPQGYHTGSGKVTASFSNLTAANIKSGINIGGTIGTLMATASLGNNSKIGSGRISAISGQNLTIQITFTTFAFIEISNRTGDESVLFRCFIYGKGPNDWHNLSVGEPGLRYTLESINPTNVVFRPLYEFGGWYYYNSSYK